MGCCLDFCGLLFACLSVNAQSAIDRHAGREEHVSPFPPSTFITQDPLGFVNQSYIHIGSGFSGSLSGDLFIGMMK
jgi:hypothetical protein